MIIYHLLTRLEKRVLNPNTCGIYLIKFKEKKKRGRLGGVGFLVGGKKGGGPCPCRVTEKPSG